MVKALERAKNLNTKDLICNIDVTMTIIKKSVAKHNENGSLCRSFMRLNGSCQPTE